jgi:hypothetical protein
MRAILKNGMQAEADIPIQNTLHLVKPGFTLHL